jgi:Arm DNA-binding domain
LLIRVGANGHKSFALRARFSGSRTPTRRALGPFYDGTPSVLQHQDPDILERDGAALSLAEAREKARLWLGMIARQRDPAAEKRVVRAAAQEKADQAARAAQTAFARVAVVWLERRIAGLKNELAIGKLIANEFTSRWKGRPIASISRDEMREAIKTIEARGAPWQGHVAWSAAVCSERRNRPRWPAGSQPLGSISDFRNSARR